MSRELVGRLLAEPLCVALLIRSTGVKDYHAARNKFERFRVFLELISRFEFDFLVAKFFQRFEFLVCSKFNHMQRDCTCACAECCGARHDS